MNIGPDVAFHIEEDAANAASLIPGRAVQPGLQPVGGSPVGGFRG
ncbi:unnamed protein product [Larinioides sclopetarius]|uniref:Uncharacterized protein n=1 Tax=Larinioides sclopetarius TaxID=280406 RepID=A0AAV2B570_9ARAC